MSSEGFFLFFLGKAKAPALRLARVGLDLVTALRDEAFSSFESPQEPCEVCDTLLHSSQVWHCSDLESEPASESNVSPVLLFLAPGHTDFSETPTQVLGVTET